MTIEGLEDNHYCAHTPIPVTVRVPTPPDEFRHSLLVNFVVDNEVKYTARYFSQRRESGENVFLVDVSMWVKQLMEDFEEQRTYTQDIIVDENHHVKEITLEFLATQGEMVRSENLFDIDNIQLLGFYNNQEELVEDDVRISTFAITEADGLVAGTNYIKYRNPDQPDGWNASPWRVFDDSGDPQPIASASDENIIVPAGAVNPRLYASFRRDRYELGTMDQAMILPEGVAADRFIPYLVPDVFDSATVTKKFANCAIDNNLQESDTCIDKCAKVWRYYPFSALIGLDARMMSISTSEDCPAVFGTCEGIDYDPYPCKGFYLKWLNDRGFYNYWMFPPLEEYNSEGEEIDLIPRNPFSQFKSSNRDTLGMEVEETVTIRDRIPKEYWDTLATLIGSPEVYMLRPNWEPGVDLTATPNDWIKMTLDDPEFTRNRRNNYAEFEVTLVYPFTYTQKRI